MDLDLNLIVIIGIVVGGLITIFFAVLAYYIHKHWYYTKVILPRTKNWVFLEVQMPKDNSDDKQNVQGGNEEGKKNLIAIAEQLFTVLSSTGSASFLSPKDYLSFEIACTNKKISFYINCPSHMQELVEKQLQAQYPQSHIDLIRGYNPFPAGGQVLATEFKLSRPYMFPMRTYKSMETDPLNALTNAMSKLNENEGAAIQYILYPAGHTWQTKPHRMALEIQQGKNPDLVVKSTSAKMVGGAFTAVKDGLMAKQPTAGQHQDLSGMYNPIHLTPMQQETVKKFEEKASRPGYQTNIRVVVSSPSLVNARANLNNLTASFLQYNMPPFNGFIVKKRKVEAILKDYMFRIYRSYGKKIILNTEELASLWHLPTPFLETPNIKWLQSKRAPAPINLSAEGVLLGRNIYRGVETPIRASRDDRRRHMYILGRTGVGKTELMKYMSVQDIQNGEGLCVIDPHGDFIEDILPHIPKHRAEEVILFEPFDVERPMGLNMLEVNSEDQKDFAVQEMISIFYKLVTDPAMLGPMFEHNMRNAMLTLMADEKHPGTLVDIPRIFTDTEFQKYKISKLNDPVVRAFWEKEMAKTSDFHKSEMLGYLVSKVGRFVENSMMRNIVGQSKSSFNFREIMDSGKILLVNLAKGKVGEVNAKLLGLILVSKIQMAAMSRADIPEDQRKDFYLYVDEFQNFITDAFSSILSEARKYHLNLIIGHQFLAQLSQGAGAHGAGSSDLRDAVFGNAGSMVSFRIGVEDAEIMAKEFAPVFNEFDLLNVDRFNAFVKLMINGTASKPFNMATYPLPKPDESQMAVANAIRQLSRLKFGRPRVEVEQEVLEASQVADTLSATNAGVEPSL